MKDKKVRVAGYIDESLKMKLDALALRENRSLSNIFETIVKEYLEKIEEVKR